MTTAGTGRTAGRSPPVGNPAVTDEARAGTWPQASAHAGPPRGLRRAPRSTATDTGAATQTSAMRDPSYTSSAARPSAPRPTRTAQPLIGSRRRGTCPIDEPPVESRRVHRGVLGDPSAPAE